MLFSGSIPALVTPFSHGAVDLDTLRKLIDLQIESGSSALVVCGTTGEYPTLTRDEQVKIIRAAVQWTRGRVPVIAGAGSNSTQEALNLSWASKEAGADAILHVTGYYNHPSERQVIDHYKVLSQTTYLPILVYNIPSRTGQELGVATIAALADLEHVSGVKDATGNVSRVTLERRLISKEFSYLSGDDATSLGYLAHGGQGCISVTANVAPGMCAEMVRLANAGDFVGARAVQDRLMPLHFALMTEPSPGGIKYAMAKLGLCGNELRSPLSPVTPEAETAIDAAMEYAGLV